MLFDALRKTRRYLRDVSVAMHSLCFLTAACITLPQHHIFRALGSSHLLLTHAVALESGVLFFVLFSVLCLYHFIYFVLF